MRALVWTIVAVAVGCAAGPPAVGAATLPVQQASGLLFVELRDAHDAPLLALLDTGANASAIDPKRSSQLPAVDTVEIVGTTGTVKAERVDIEGLHFGALALPRLRATRRDLGGLLAPKDRRAMGPAAAFNGLKIDTVPLQFALERAHARVTSAESAHSSNQSARAYSNGSDG